ncbi:MAG: PrgI family protein [Candidatus Magasanikbacteria bacterium]
MDQQFVVPQFIDVESKIFGPISVRQFLILLAGAILIFIAYRLLTFVLFIVATLLIGGIALTFAFVEIKGQQFHYFVLNLFQYAKKDKLRIWDKRYTQNELDYLRKKQRAEEKRSEMEPGKKPERSRMRDLSLVVNTGGYYEGEKSLQQPSEPRPGPEDLEDNGEDGE